MLSGIWDLVINVGQPVHPTAQDAPSHFSPPAGDEMLPGGGGIGDSNKVGMFREAERANKMGKIVIFSVIAVFNACFWGIAINEYLRPAELYIKRRDPEHESQSTHGILTNE